MEPKATEVKFTAISAGSGDHLFALSSDGVIYERIPNPDMRTSAQHEAHVWRRLPSPPKV